MDLVDSTFSDDEGNGVFEKPVAADALESVYENRTAATVRGVDADYIMEDDGMVCLGTSDSFIAKELGMGRADKYYYEGMFPKDKVTLRKIVIEHPELKKGKASSAGRFFKLFKSK